MKNPISLLLIFIFLISNACKESSENADTDTEDQSEEVEQTARATITLPRFPSPAAVVEQTIGLSTVTIRYSRPNVVASNGVDRTGKIWGKQVPYDFDFRPAMGGAGTQGPADNLMVLSRHPSNSNQRILAIRGKDMDDKRLLFEVFNEGADWQCEGEVEEVQKTNERQAIVDYLGLEGMSFKDIQQAAKDEDIDVSPNSVNTMLRKMVEEGTLTQNQVYGKYSVAGKTNEMIRIKHTGKD